jgi:hypothetical protein
MTIQRKLWITIYSAIVVALLLGFFLGIAVTKADAPDHKVTICHATSSITNPYVRIVVDEHATKGHFDEHGTPLAGHEEDILLQGEQDCPGPVVPPPCTIDCGPPVCTVDCTPPPCTVDCTPPPVCTVDCPPVPCTIDCPVIPPIPPVVPPSPPSGGGGHHSGSVSSGTISPSFVGLQMPVQEPEVVIQPQPQAQSLPVTGQNPFLMLSLSGLAPLLAFGLKKLIFK